MLAGIELKGISVSDYSEGSLLLSTGEYSHTGGKSDRTLLSSGFSQTVTESVLPVTTNGQAGGAAAECLIFPTLSGTTEGLKIKVATKGRTVRTARIRMKFVSRLSEMMERSGRMKTVRL